MKAFTHDVDGSRTEACKLPFCLSAVGHEMTVFNMGVSLFNQLFGRIPGSGSPLTRHALNATRSTYILDTEADELARGAISMWKNRPPPLLPGFARLCACRRLAMGASLSRLIRRARR